MQYWRWQAICGIVGFLLAGHAYASLGDRLDDFKDCLAICSEANCEDELTPIPLHHRLLLWTCPSECDYTCQHIVTSRRLSRPVPYNRPILQFHGKWPFHRFLGLQEPASVLFSLLNCLAHLWGLAQLRQHVPLAYPLRRYYVIWGYFGCVAWVASMVFHTRDFKVTERADYFAAGASVLYGLFCAPVRVFRLDDPAGKKPWQHSVVRLWAALCVVMYMGHVGYLTLWRWDYGYNMAANIAVGVVQNVLWTGFSVVRFRRSGRWWQAWPAMIVAWVCVAMSLEVLDFVPWRLMVDAHSLWHLGTVVPTIWWYRFLVRDAQEDMQNTRLKA